jgi:Tol biopolymer transport system component
LTRDGRSSSPEWSADGQRVGWIYSDSSSASIRWQRADGSGTPEIIPTQRRAPFRFVFMPDGKSLAVVVGGPFRHDIVLVPINGSSAPRPITDSEGDELQPSISPDGQWMAFTSNETGRSNVFVTNTSDRSTRVQVTTDPTSEPVWLADGHSLIVRAAGSFLKISLSFSPRIEVTRRDTLFADSYSLGNPDRFFDVSRTTGELVTLTRAGSKRDRIIVVTGWLDELRQRMAQAAKP